MVTVVGCNSDSRRGMYPHRGQSPTVTAQEVVQDATLVVCGSSGHVDLQIVDFSDRHQPLPVRICSVLASVEASCNDQLARRWHEL